MSSRSNIIFYVLVNLFYNIMRKHKVDEFVTIGGIEVPFVNVRIDLSESTLNIDDLNDIYYNN